MEEELEEGNNGEPRDEGPAGGGDTVQPEEEEHFDISLAASHSYMGGALVALRGRRVLEEGWRGRLPVLAHRGAVFPGQTVPMQLAHAHDAALMAHTVHEDKLFGLLCPDASGTRVSGYGAVCEVFEAAVEEGERSVTFKARATQRFRFLHMHKHAAQPLHAYARVRAARVCVLAEVAGGAPLLAARLTSLDPLRGRPPLQRRLRAMDAAVTPWPLFLYDIFDYGRMRRLIADYFKTMMFDKLPEDPVSLSFWVASNLALGARERLALLQEDNALRRLHMALRLIARDSALCCSACRGQIALREDMFPMSSEGITSNYTNLSGYTHDVLTVARAANTVLTGSATAEYSWFPGYTWTIALCSGCMEHVGWRFNALKSSLRPQQFYGLCRNYVQPLFDDDEAV